MLEPQIFQSSEVHTELLSAGTEDGGADVDGVHAGFSALSGKKIHPFFRDFFKSNKQNMHICLNIECLMAFLNNIIFSCLFNFLL